MAWSLDVTPWLWRECSWGRQSSTVTQISQLRQALTEVPQMAARRPIQEETMGRSSGAPGKRCGQRICPRPYHAPFHAGVLVAPTGTAGAWCSVLQEKRAAHCTHVWRLNALPESGSTLGWAVK